MPRNSRIVTSPGGWESWSGSVAGKAIQFIEKYLILPDTREPMVLHPYQQDLIEQWADPTTKCHVTVIGAGNAKTTTLAAYVVSHLFLTEEAHVPVVAATVHQAWDTTLGTAARLAEIAPMLSERSETLRGQSARQGIHVPYRAGRAEAVASGAKGLQGLKPSMTCLEEMSVADMDTFSALMARNKRPGCKLVGITTPSFEPDNALVNIQRAARSGQPIPNVVLREYISQQKDHRDESYWHDANPGLLTLPTILDIETLRTDLAIMPEQHFRAYHLCQEPSGSESCWLNSLDEKGDETGDSYDIWQRGVSAYRFIDGAPTWVGVDVAKSHDHAAVVWGQFRDDGKLHVKGKVFTPNPEIDPEDIADHLRYLDATYDLRGIWYDPSYFYNAPMLAREGLPLVEVPPTDQRMAPLVGHTYQAIRRTRITHDDDQWLTKPVLAAKRKYTANGFTLEKRHFAHKIDAAIALVLCHGAATGQPVEEYTPDSFKIH